MYITAITGASGAIFGIRLIEELLRRGLSVAAVITPAARTALSREVLGDAPCPEFIGDVLADDIDRELLKQYAPGDWTAPFASGSAAFEAVIVAPCSMKTLAAAAAGYGDNIVTRAIDVALKERRRVLLMPRETPLNLIHIENMARLKRAGADILPPSIAFYTKPQTLEDAVNFIVGKALSLLGFNHNLFAPWGE